MRKTVLIAILTFSAAGFSFAHGPAKSGDPIANVRNVLIANARGFETGDFHALDSIWAHDKDVTVFESGHANYGWEDYRDHHLKTEVEEMKNVTYRLTDIQPKVAGNTAWATFKYALTADYKGQKVDAAGLGTAVLEKRGDAWKIVHWHTSAPRKPPAAQHQAPK